MQFIFSTKELTLQIHIKQRKKTVKFIEIKKTKKKITEKIRNSQKICYVAKIRAKIVKPGSKI